METGEKLELWENFCFEKEDFACYGLRPFAVLKIFQSVATKHANSIGLGFETMAKNDLLWVTMRIKFSVEKQPLPNQKLKILTFPSAKNFYEFDRDFLIFDENENLLVKGTSKWCIIDKNSRHIVKMSSIDVPQNNLRSPTFDTKFLKSETFEPKFCADNSFQVLPQDIDQNGHLNNTIYAKMTESLISKKNEIKFFQINFLHEALCGQRIDVFCKTEDEKFLVLGKLCESEPCFSAEILY